MGNLRRTGGDIIKIRSRDRSGRLIHKNEFSVNDDKAVERELRTWKDLLGVKRNTFRNIVENPIDKEENEHIAEMVRHSINSSNNKTKQALSK